MAVFGMSPTTRNDRLIPAVLALLVTGLVSVVDVRLFGESWPLTWLPFAVVALWPRHVSTGASGLLLLAGGLWVDWTSWGAPGQWPLVFLITYALIRPGARGGRRGLLAGIRRFVLALLVGVPVMILTGWMVYESWPDWMALGRGLLVVTVILPIFILVRDGLAGRMSEED
ncbi:hypothetical protein [uncultured Algimonas sp.]|uniref:hypothetical protein n=1 Tax=uncultured Algimonas sp. TaxID=1547920 RepID=UPI002603FCCB|nr:hypothetical protein [uncultured Algimonas sp.]